MERSEVVDLLHEQVVEIVFTKVDGTKRTMQCTLNADNLPKVEVSEDADTEVKPRKSNPDVMSVFDMEKKDWRSFRWDNLQTVNGEKIGS